jgi:uncharacterized membrane protein
VFALSEYRLLENIFVMQILISRTLRWGVTIASVLAGIGGIFYFIQHGGELLNTEKYQSFAYTDAQDPATTTFGGILEGAFSGNSESLIQLGVIALFLTPLMRVVLSLFDFLKQRDWLYVAITAFVLGVIVMNSIVE